MVPRVGPFSKDDSELEYSIASLQMNQRFSEALGQGLQNVPDRPVSLKFHSNDMTDEQFLEILKNTDLIKNMIITDNPKISRISFEALSVRNMENLSLEHNRIGDYALDPLLKI